MADGQGYPQPFLTDLGDDIIAAEKKDHTIWATPLDPQLNTLPKWGAKDPLDGLLGIISKDPKTATAFLDPGADGSNDHLQYLLHDRDWKLGMKWTGPVGNPNLQQLTYVEDPNNRSGFGAALEAAATGHVPDGQAHIGDDHTVAQARVTHDMISILDKDGNANKLTANLRRPVADVLANYVADTHNVLSRVGPYQTHDGVWSDAHGVHMSVKDYSLVHLMRGVADDPSAYTDLFNAEKVYSAATLAQMPKDPGPGNSNWQVPVQNAASAFGAYDAVRADVVLDKRDAAQQWARDTAHGINSSVSALTTYLPKVVDFTAPEVPDTPGGEGKDPFKMPSLDPINRITDMATYDWSKEAISEASRQAGDANIKNYSIGQQQVDRLVSAWGTTHGMQSSDTMIESLQHAGLDSHDTARDQAFGYLRRTK
ncbi:DUF6571 family protein [Streptantibioticus ferralitis]|uniref:DUF6571 domain-containing protein n=1 Tax=Streptantibioticus ferralitis TaxID=236510 RepID=A0ABT5ZAH0_9ACTN|nr:DUF6571 family protein [Streptantibioticus ferralitis]MDF2260754.1 hypothetical protein [Streptantibioticus ferralitis]